MIIVAKNDSTYESHYPQENDNDDSTPYQERRQKDMGADNPHYHWDYTETLCFCGNE